MDDDWSLKKLQRRIVLSSTYRQSSHETEEMRRRDPDNLLLGRMNRRRLDFEALRDSLLAVSGALDATLGGKAVDLTSQPFSRRRTIYGLIERQNLPGLFRTFDFASPDIHNPQRFTTTVPQQALFLLNSPFVIEKAKALVARGEVQSIAEPRARAIELYRLALGRVPSDAELAPVLDFVATAGRQHVAQRLALRLRQLGRDGPQSGRRSRSSPSGPASIGRGPPSIPIPSSIG